MKFSTLTRLLLVLVIQLSVLSQASATIYYWRDAAVSTSWTLSSNWSFTGPLGVAATGTPGSADVVYFQNSVVATMPVISAGSVTVNTINIATTVSNVITLLGGTLNVSDININVSPLSGNGLVISGGALNIGNTISFSGNTTTGTNISLSGGVINAYGLKFINKGSVNISGTGAFRINSANNLGVIIEANANATITNNSAAIPSFVVGTPANYGIWVKATGQFTLNGTGRTRVWDVQGGYNSIQVVGTFSNNSNNLQLDSPAAGGFAINALGTFNNNTNASINILAWNNDVISVGGTFNNDAAANINIASTTGSGIRMATAASIFNNGGTININNAVINGVDVAQGAFTNSNNGILNIKEAVKGIYVEPGASFTNSGDLDIENLSTLAYNAINADGVFTNNGTISILGDPTAFQYGNAIQLDNTSAIAGLAFTNSNTINIDNWNGTSSAGIFISNGAGLSNSTASSTITINGIPNNHGIYNNGGINNQGTINIFNTGASSLYLNTASTFVNGFSANLNIDNSIQDVNSIPSFVNNGLLVATTNNPSSRIINQGLLDDISGSFTPWSNTFGGYVIDGTRTPPSINTCGILNPPISGLFTNTTTSNNSVNFSLTSASAEGSSGVYYTGGSELLDFFAPVILLSTATSANVDFTFSRNGGSAINRTIAVPINATSSCIATTSTTPACSSTSNGTAVVTTTGGVTPYSYNWSDGSSGSAVTGLFPGTYTVTSTDINGCTATAIATVDQVGSNIVATNTDCSINNGSIIDTVPIVGNTYIWSPSVSIGSSATGLAEGFYSLTVVSGGVGCAFLYNISTNGRPLVNTDATPDYCFLGDGTGTVTSVSGGVSPYTYSWDNLQTTQTATGLTVGFHSVTVTDVAGCTSSGAVNVGEGYPFATITATPTNSCVGSPVSLVANVTGPVGSYSYVWDFGGIGDSVIVSPTTSTTYSVTATYNSGNTSSPPCTASGSYQVNPVAAPNPNVSGSTTVCRNSSTTYTILNTNANQTYAWAINGGAPSTATGTSITVTWTNPSNGNMTLVATDTSTGCSSTSFRNININNVGLNVVPQGVSCFGGSNGSATATLVNGLPAITYLWSNSQTTQTATGLFPGTYLVSATDSNGCTATASTTVTQPIAALTATATSGNINCFGANNGFVNTFATGGTAPYTYVWSSPPVLPSQANIINLAAGSYIVTITDVNGCTTSTSQTISSPSTPLLINATVTNIACASAATGAITTTTSGGTSPYTYIWNDGNTNASRIGLTFGAYTVTVTDANGCTTTFTTNVSSAAPIVISISSVNPLCSGGATGTAMANTTGGTGTFTYSWNTAPIQTTQTATGLSAGTYNVMVTDANACTASSSKVITSPAPITASITGTNTCTGSSTGSATVSITGGATPYSYIWNTAPVQNTLTVTGLSAGSHSVTVTDTNGCTVSATTTTNTNALPIVTITGTSTVCLGSSISLTANSTAGAYSWTGPSGFTSTSNTWTLTGVNNANQGNYNVTATNALGCTASATQNVVVSSLAPPVVSNTGPYCAGATIQLNATGGSTYAWSGPGGFTSTIQNPTLAAVSSNAGVYSITATDTNGCTNIGTTTVVVNSAPTVIVSNGGPYCDGQNIQLNVSGGSTYAWSGPSGFTSTAQNPIQTASVAGVYTVTVTNLGCTASGNTTVVVNPSPVGAVVISGATNICSGGTIALSAALTAGVGYSWSGPNGFTSNSNAINIGSISSLNQGSYTVTATNLTTGCTASATRFVNVLATPSGVTASSSGPFCTGGSIQLNSTGGTVYTWSGPSAFTSTIQNPIRNTITAAMSGTYVVTATGANGCTASAFTNVAVNTNPVITATSGTPYCVGQTLQLNATGANSYNWSGPVAFTSNTANPTRSNLIVSHAGIYSVTGVDGSGCTAGATAIVAVNAAPTVNITGATTICAGNTVFLTANASSVTYSWSGPNGFSSTSNSVLIPNSSAVNQGNYTVTVTNTATCTATATQLMTISPLPDANCTGSSTACRNSTNNYFITNLTGGATYSWSITGGTSASATGSSINITWTNPSNGSITVVATNVGCSSTVTKSVNIESVGLTINALNVNCNGGSTGQLSAAVTNALAPIAYTWSTLPVQITSTATGLTAGTYSLTVVDQYGCTASGTNTVTQPAALSATISGTNVTCFGSNTGSASVFVSGGTTPYNYAWSGTTQTNATVNGLAAGSHTVTITDAKGCTLSATKTITQPANALSASVSTSNITCFGVNNGTATVAPTGGTSPYTYTWSTGATTATINSLSASNYIITITDANGCFIVNNALVTQPSTLSVTISPVNVVCAGTNSGSASAAVIGGTAPYTYVWSSSSTLSTATGLTAGVHTVSITDTNGCTASSSAILSQPSPISVFANATPVLCYGQNSGAANVSVGGGNGGYSYLWSTGATIPSITGLIGGTYTVTITDSQSCTASTSVVVIEPASPLNTSTNVTDITCFGYDNGTASVVASGGTSPYNYIWNTIPTQNSSIVSNLSPASYTVIVTDFNGCITTASATILEPTAVNITLDAYTDLTCNGAANGSIDISVSGGALGYNYSWSNGAITEDLTGLSGGTYILTASDNAGCTATFTKTITEPDSLIYTAAVTDMTCFGYNDGAINLTISGGVTPYTYAWSNGAITQNLNFLSSGSYSATITDANGCQISTNTYAISEPSVIVIGLTHTDETCFSACDGTIYTSVSGGTVPYTYLWSDGSTGSILFNACPGNYTFTLYDANSCSASSADSITPASQLIATFDAFASQVTTLCTGTATGSIAVNISGGVAPYTFAWSNGATTEDIASLVAGIYTLTVTDANSCQQTLNQIITDAAPLSVVTSVTNNVSCFGGTNGQASALAIGGTNTFYTYTWGTIPPQVNTVATGLVAGTYTITVEDGNACTATGSVTITQPSSALLVTETHTNVLCSGGNNGAINLSLTGGTAPYVYTWSNGATAQNINTLIAGTYTVTVTDTNLCTFIQSVVITEPANALTATAVSTNMSCNGICNGTVTVSATGGTIPYTYDWSGSLPNIANPTNVCAGSYIVTVTDANACTVTANSVSVTEPTALTLSSVITLISCASGNDGAINVTITGGTPSYTYNWGGILTEDRTSLVAGIYTITVTDLNACTATLSHTLVNPTPIALTVNATSTCSGASNGTATATTSAGTSPFTYVWSGTVQTTATVTGLATGNYTVTVNDANTCTATATYTINNIPVAPVSITALSTVLNCNTPTRTLTAAGTGTYLWNAQGGNATTANITASAAGTYVVTVTDANTCTASAQIAIVDDFTPPLATTGSALTICAGSSTSFTALGGVSYAWSNGLGANATATVNNAIAGAYSYTVTVTGSNGCIATAIQSLTVTPAPSISIAGTTIICAGSNTILTASGGVSYAWSNSSTTAASTPITTAGAYTVTITDASGCTAVSTTNVSVNTAPLATITGVTTICAGNSTTLTAGGGVAYLWSDGSISSTSGAITTSGTYTVTVADGNTCTATATQNISVTPLPNAAITGTTNICAGGNTTLTATGGSTYNWSNGSISATSALITTSGAYAVTVTNNGCSAVASTLVNVLPAIVLTTNVTSTCFGASTGTATVNATNGTAPYSYSWSNGQATTTATGLIAGTYTVTITDSNSCAATTSAMVTQPSTALIATTTSGDVSCFGGNNGFINVLASGGTASYSYTWTPTLPAQAIQTNLAANTYSVTVTDAAACTTTASAVITAPSTALVTTITPSNPLCFGTNTGSAIASTIGGTSPYSYAWSNGQPVAAATGLLAGTYTVTTTDANACTSVVSVIITQPSAILAIASATNTCFGASTGTATVNVTNGTAPYSYTWSNGQATATATGLVAGTYTVTIIDSNACTTTASAPVTQPSTALSATTTSGNVSCFGGNNGFVNALASGGMAPYTYAWTPTLPAQAYQTNLAANTYSVTITDTAACTTTVSAVITAPSAYAVTITPSSPLCNGGTDGSVNLTVSGATAPYTYQWNVGFTTEDITNVSAGLYVVTITDANACITIQNATVSNPANFGVTITSVSPSCNGNANGTITMNVTGGALPYTYDWGTGSQSSNIFTGLFAGTYVITITDVNGCTTVRNRTLSQPLALNINETHTDVSCNAGNNGSITLTISGGVAPYTYLWSNGQTSAGATGLVAGIYNVTVTDANSCTAVRTVFVNQPSVIAIIGTTTPITCFGGTNGTITLSSTGGVAPITYNWGGGITGATRTGLTAGTYTVTLTDANTCTATANYTFTQPAAISITTIQTNPTCGSSNGTIATVILGGTPSYGYIWSNTQSGAMATGLTAGTYTLTLTDANTCTATATANITNTGALSADITSVDTVICVGESTNLFVSVNGASGGITYTWSNAATGNIQSVNPTTNTAYQVTVSSGGVCTATASINIIVNPVPAPVITLTSGGCAGISSTLHVTPTNMTSYQWVNGSTTDSLETTLSDNYSVTITDINGCSATGFYNLTIPAAIPAPLVPSSSLVLCSGNNLTINVAGTGTANHALKWSDGVSTFPLSSNAVSGIISNPSITADATYTVYEYDLTTGCVGLTTTINIDVIAPPSAPLAQLDSVCIGTSAQLSMPSLGVGGGASYRWYDQATNGNLLSIGQVFNTPVLNANAIYYVAIDSGGCESTRNIYNVTANPIPATPVISSNAPICSGATLNLAVTNILSGASYTWINTAGQVLGNGPTLSIANATAGTYTVIVSKGGCTNQAAVNVDVNSPIANTGLFAPSNICAGQNLPLLSTNYNNATYTWTFPNGSVTTTTTSDLIVPNATLSGEYRLQITQGSCTGATDSVLVNILAVPAMPIVSVSSVFCQGDTVTLQITNVQNGMTYNWVPIIGQPFQATGFQIENLSAGTQIYNVYASTGAGLCTSDSTLVTITTNPRPVVNITNSGPVCVNDPINITSTTTIAGTYNWTGPNNFTSANQNINFSNAALTNDGTYSLVVTSTAGCSSIPVFTNVIIRSLPIAVAVGNDGPACLGDSITLTAPILNGFSYQWTGPNGFISTDANPVLYNVTPAINGIYSLNLSIGSCISPLSTTLVTVNTPPTIYAGVDTTVEVGRSLQLNATGTAEAYEWTPQSNLNYAFRADPVFNSIFSGDTLLYVVVGYENNNPCPAYDSILIVVRDAHIGNDAEVGPADIITPNNDGYNDAWIVENVENLRNYEINILDREGMIIYTTNDYNNDWNGIYKGKDLPEGTYWYVIYLQGYPPKTGAITILR